MYAGWSTFLIFRETTSPLPLATHALRRTTNQSSFLLFFSLLLQGFPLLTWPAPLPFNSTKILNYSCIFFHKAEFNTLTALVFHTFPMIWSTPLIALVLHNFPTIWSPYFSTLKAWTSFLLSSMKNWAHQFCSLSCPRFLSSLGLPDFTPFHCRIYGKICHCTSFFGLIKDICHPKCLIHKPRIIEMAALITPQNCH